MTGLVTPRSPMENSAVYVTSVQRGLTALTKPRQIPERYARAHPDDSSRHRTEIWPARLSATSEGVRYPQAVQSCPSPSASHPSHRLARAETRGAAYVNRLESAWRA